MTIVGAIASAIAAPVVTATSNILTTGSQPVINTSKALRGIGNVVSAPPIVYKTNSILSNATPVISKSNHLSFPVKKNLSNVFNVNNDLNKYR